MQTLLAWIASLVLAILGALCFALNATGAFAHRAPVADAGFHQPLAPLPQPPGTTA